MILPLYKDYLKEFEYYIIEDFLYLKYIKIHKKYRRQGIGKRVMKDLMGYCEENNLNLFLFPANSNSKYLRCLIKFYSGCGMPQLINDEGFIVFVKYYGRQRPDIPVLPRFTRDKTPFEETQAFEAYTPQAQEAFEKEGEKGSKTKGESPVPHYNLQATAYSTNP